MTAQLTEVDQALMSVRKMVQTGNKVVFADEGSYIEDVRTGNNVWMKENNGMYMLSLRVNPPHV